MSADEIDLDVRTCANPWCGRPVDGREFVLQVSTGHLRWFCNIECAIESKQDREDRIASQFGLVPRARRIRDY